MLFISSLKLLLSLQRDLTMKQLLWLDSHLSLGGSLVDPCLPDKILGGTSCLDEILEPPAGPAAPFKNPLCSRMRGKGFPGGWFHTEIWRRTTLSTLGVFLYICSAALIHSTHLSLRVLCPSFASLFLHFGATAKKNKCYLTQALWYCDSHLITKTVTKWLMGRQVQHWTMIHTPGGNERD